MRSRSSCAVSPLPRSVRADGIPANDTVESVQSRAAHKLALPGEGRDIVIKYLYCDVYYTLEDGPFLLRALTELMRSYRGRL